jgi:type VI secretion system secreted protein VgrG
LLFDDTDGQGRVQLRCTHGASSLELGHLIHAAENYRGSFRGQGTELRTDAYGAVRAERGVLISSYAINHIASKRDPAGENVAGVGLLTQVGELVEIFHAAAVTHQTVGLPFHSTAGKVANSRDGMITLVCKGSLGANAGQSLQLANGETIVLASGENAQFNIGSQMRLQVGQVIGVLGGVAGVTKGKEGLQLITSKDTVDIQAQAGELKVGARDEINVISANGHVDWAAAVRISLSTTGGANIVIENGNIEVRGPGKITVHAGRKELTAAEKTSYKFPVLPSSVCVECLRKRAAQRSAFVNRGG